MLVTQIQALAENSRHTDYHPENKCTSRESCLFKFAFPGGDWWGHTISVGSILRFVRWGKQVLKGVVSLMINHGFDDKFIRVPIFISTRTNLT